jgi:RNA ligase (TIGR02306 family)
MRKLARITKVDGFAPIEGADRIVAAHVGGWTVITPKAAQTADPDALFVYLEVDAVVPEKTAVKRPAFQPLMDIKCQDFTLMDEDTETVFKVRGHRLRTKRIRGVYSQGFLLTIGDVFTTEEMNALAFADGMDVTNYLEVVKYAPAPKEQQSADNNPRGKWDDSLAPKTDAERLQNLTRYWDEIQQMQWMPTLKVDGTSMTVANDAGEMRVFSRNLEVGEDNERAIAAKRNGLWAWLEANPGYTVQGELVGEGIQKNRLGIKGRRVLVFSVWRDGVKLQRSEWPEFLEAMGVPVLGDEWMPQRFDTPEALIEAVNGLRGHIGSGLNEGIVYHLVREPGDTTPLPRWMSSRENFKVVSNKYLAKFE